MAEPRNLILLDGNAPWVCSMFAAMSASRSIDPPVVVHAIRPQSAPFYRHFPGKLFPALSGQWTYRSPAYRERYAIVPGWQRYFPLSTHLLKRVVRSLIKGLGNVEGVIYTLPQYAGIAEAMSAEGVRGFYYAHDVFRFYDWPAAWTVGLERRMLNACEITFAVAQAVRDDFQHQTTRSVLYSPMAVDESFVKAMAVPLPVPRELGTLPRPVVGCIGQINSTYDWDLVEAIGEKLPGVTFAFIGPIIEEDPVRRKQIDGLFQQHGNMRWLGRRPHKEIPAYLNAFDVLFNPLAVNEHNNRRSPLRLYDYLATSKPVISTAIQEAYAHEGLVDIAIDAQQCAELISKALDSAHRVDQQKRRAYIERQTWDCRAGQMIAAIRETTR
jgi:Glycosyl transferases group 1